MLKGKKRSQHTLETVLDVSSLPFTSTNALALPLLIRNYWASESGLHHRLDVTAREDFSRVRHRNSLLALGLVRRAAMGCYHVWRTARKNKRQATLKDFFDALHRHQHRVAWQLIKGSAP